MAGRLRVKICGVTRPEDAEAAGLAGADAVGINLWPGSRRYVPEDAAAEVVAAAPPGVLVVGVFVDAPPERVRDVAERLGLDHCQLHGHETPEDVRAAGPRAFKALRLHGPAALDGLDAWPGPFVLVDAYRAGAPGGTGVPVDLDLAASAAARRPTWLAGGLDSRNVGAAVRQVRPYGVDVATGVEERPGIKVRALIEAFVAAARGGP